MREEQEDQARTISEQCTHLTQTTESLEELSNLNIKEALHMCIHHVRQSTSTSDHSLQNNFLGFAWICLGQIFIKLYVPSIPLDPSLESSFQSDYAAWSLGRASARYMAQTKVHDIFMGGTESPRIDDLAQQMARASERVENAERVQLYRPRISQVHQLQSEFDYCLSAISDQGAIAGLVAAFTAADSTAASQARTFLSSWAKLEDRMRSYEGYQDLIQPLLEATAQIKTGFELLYSIRAQASDMDQASIMSESFSDPLEVANMTTRTMSNPAETIHFGVADLSRQVAMRLKVALFQQHLVGSDSPACDTMQDLTRRLFESWFVERQEKEQQAAEDSSLFKYSAPTESAVEDYKELFPDYEEQLTSTIPSTSNDSAVDQLVFGLHGQLLSQKWSNLTKAATEQSFVAVMESLIDISAPLSSEHWRHTTPRSLATASYNAERNLYKLLQNSKDKKRYDFYRDSNSQETCQIVPLLNQLRSRVAEISEAWPENSTLIEIDEAIGRLLSSTIATPLAQVLTMLEQMFGLLAQWQEVASREYSVETLFEAVRSQIVAWRRFELSCWPHLFDLEEAAVIRSDAKIWFNLYEVVIFAPTKQGSSISYEFMHQSVSSLMQFMRSSSAGQYTARLKYLKAFSHHASLGAGKHEAFTDLANAIALVASYFESFENKISDHMARERKVLAKEVTEVIKLASWRDTNVFALRESARRSHRTLYKIVHKFRKILNAPIGELLRSGPSETRTKTSALVSNTFDLVSFDRSRLGRVSSRPARFVEVERTATRIGLATTGSELFSQNYLKLFVDDTLRSIDELKAETPTSFDKAQVGLVKHLKNRKYKLMSDSFKTLKLLGLRSTLRPEDLNRQKNIEAMFLTTDAVTDAKISPIIDQYFFRIADILPNIRGGYANHSEDVNATDVKRGTGYFDSLLFSALRERSMVITFTRQLHALEDLFYNYRSITLEEGKPERSLILSQNGNSILQAVTQANISAKMLEQLLSLTETYFSAHLALSTSTEKPLASQDWWSQIVEKSTAHTKAIQNLPSSIYPSADAPEILSSFEVHRNSIIEQVEAYGNMFPDGSYMFSTLVEWLESLTVATATQATVSLRKEVLDIEVLEQRLQRICDKILLATQAIQKRYRQVTSLQDDNLWFSKSSAGRCKLLQAACLDTIHSDLAGEIAYLKSAFSTAPSTELQALCTNYAPIIQAYIGLCRKLLNDFLDFHQHTSQCTLLVGKTLDNLAKNGFCSPQPSDPTPGDSKATKDGTGLGEGQGVEDITKDIEDDEDLGDTEGLEDSKNDAEQEEDKAEAKEMQDDVGGDLEDVEPNSDNDGSNSDEEDADEEEIDDEIGEVDDQDETALDEKMWDEDPDDLRSKDTEKKQDGTNQDQDQDDVDMVDKDDTNDQPETEEKEGKEEKPENMPEEADVPDQESDADGDDQEDAEAASPPDAHPNENQMEAAENLDLPEDLQMDNVSDTEEANGEDEGLADESEKDLSEDEMKEDELENDADEHSGDELNDENPDNGQMDGDEQDATADDASELEPETMQDNDAEDPMSKQPDDQDDNNIDEGGPDEGGKDSSRQDPGTKELEGESNDTERNDPEPDIQMDPAGNEGDNAAGTEGRAMGDDSQAPSESTSDELRSFGEALEKFRRMLRINNASENVKDAGKNEDERQDFADADQFEHVGDDQEADTQAMGPNANDDVSGDQQDENHAMPELENNVTEPEASELEDITMREGNPSGPDREGLESGDSKDNADLLKHTGIVDAEEEEEVDFDDAPIPDATMPAVSTLEMTSNSSLLWRKHEQDTRDLANGLCEQLRLILEPTMATKMRGDYRTGKRLNMRRIIPYIASQFKKDKIWMRRSKPSKRQYQVMLAIDDSKSMAESSSVQLAFDTVALVSTALSVLEVGQMSVVKFGAEPTIVHAFQDPFSSESGAKVFESFTFDQTKTNVKALASQTLEMFRTARASQHSSGAELWQLQLIISDGICEDHESIRRILRQAQEEHIMVIFLVIDTLHGAKKHSILQMSQVKYVTNPVDGTKKLKVQQYMEDFAFENFLIIQDVRELPELLCSTLRQFFAASQ